MVERQLRNAYTLMLGHFGHLCWWPGETPFEVCVGAILTQNTSWTNVEKAITNLKKASVLNPCAMLNLPPSDLAELIRPAGYFNIKAQRLRSFLTTLVHHYSGDLDRMLAGKTPEVRRRLLGIHGIGPETADSMLLYAGNHLSFVVDAYTKRIFTRHAWWSSDSPDSKGKSNSAADYISLQHLCEKSLNEKAPDDLLDYWQDYHAQLVMVGKHFCRNKNPKCGECPLECLL